MRFFFRIYVKKCLIFFFRNRNEGEDKSPYGDEMFSQLSKKEMAERISEIVKKSRDDG